MAKILKITAVIVILIGLLTSTFFLGEWYSSYSLDQKLNSHDLLAKRIFLSRPNDILVNFEPLRSELRDDLDFYKDRVSLYFEYLPTGTSIRIGDTQHLVAASLLKVPAVMNLYHLSEMGKINLDSQVTVQKEWLDDNYGDMYKKGYGYKISLRQLAKTTLEKSDNTALNGVQAITSKHSSELETMNAFDALDVDYVDDTQTSMSLSARAYSSFLKCLYFACYVSADNSQEIMGYLTHSTYGGVGRLGEYIPKNIRIAHKIGVAGEEVQSDCGIVYVKNRHYLLCIMLNEDKERGQEVIAQISKKVYDYVTKR